MKKIFKNYIVLILLLLSVINIDIFMPLSDNGILNVALIELLLPIVIFIIFLLICLKKKPIVYKKIIITIGIFILYYIILFIFRYVHNLEYKQSLLTIKVSIFPIIILFLYKYLEIPREKIIKCLILFNFIINILQLRHLTNLRMSMFLGNIVVYLAIITALYLINLYTLFKKDTSISMKIIAFFNAFITIFVPLLVGARSSFVLSLLLTIFSLIYLIIIKKFKELFLIFTLIILSISLNWFCWNYVGIASYSNRILPQIFNVDKIDNKTSIPTEEIIDTNQNFNIITTMEKQKSDDLRSYLFNRSIEEIKKSPFLGTGLIYFDVETDYGVSLQSAHNFVLEYLNAYGIIGCILFILIHLSIWSYFNFKNKRMREILILSCGTILVQSLVEPTFLIVPIVIVYYTIYALALNWEVRDE